MTDKTVKKNLVEVIKSNPGCTAIIDNDCWALYRESPYGPNTAPEEDDPKFEQWEKDNRLAGDDDVLPLGDGGYGSGNCYGGDILQALAVIVGIKVESV